jgi:hypothetical protein
LYWRTSVVRSQSGWRGPGIVIAQQRNMVIGFMGGIVFLCHRTRARLFERSSRDEKPSPLLDDDAFLPFQGKRVDSPASPALTAQDADDFVQSPFVTEFMPVEFGDVEFRDVAETGRHLGVCSDDPEQAARVARASAAGPEPNISRLMNTAPVRDTVPDVSSSAAEPVTAVEHMEDDEDDDDRPPGKVLPSDSLYVLKPSHSAPEHASQPNADPVADFPSLRTRSKRPVPDEDDDNSVYKTLKRRRAANVFILPQLCTCTTRRYMTRATRLIGINCRTKSLSPRWRSWRSRSASGLRTGTLPWDVTRTWHFARVTSQHYCLPLVKYPPVDV